MHQATANLTATAGNARPSSSGTGCELQPIGRGLHELKLSGQFPPRWLANLTSALAARGISIERGSAIKVTPSLWQATFEILPAGGVLPVGLDCLALAHAAGAAGAAAGEIHLESYTLDLRGDALFVEIFGPDCVGFLEALLKTFAFFSLFPAEVHIDTPGGRVHDRFWLKGVGGLSPSESSRQGLQIELEKLRR